MLEPVAYRHLGHHFITELAGKNSDWPGNGA